MRITKSDMCDPHNNITSKQIYERGPRSIQFRIQVFQYMASGEAEPDHTTAAQQQSQEIVCPSEAWHDGTPTSTEPGHDLVSTPTTYYSGADLVDNHVVEEAEGDDRREARVEQADQKELTKKDWKPPTCRK